jgi:hypothetical protein
MIPRCLIFGCGLVAVLSRAAVAQRLPERFVPATPRWVLKSSPLVAVPIRAASPSAPEWTASGAHAWALGGMMIGGVGTLLVFRSGIPKPGELGEASIAAPFIVAFLFVAAMPIAFDGMLIGQSVYEVTHDRVEPFVPPSFANAEWNPKSRAKATLRGMAAGALVGLVWVVQQGSLDSTATASTRRGRRFMQEAWPPAIGLIGALGSALLYDLTHARPQRPGRPPRGRTWLSFP